MNENEAIDLNEFLERVQDDKELLLELLDIYTGDFQEKRKALGEAIEKDDYEQIIGIAHSLKGASGNISAKPLRQIFMSLEEMGRVKKIDGASDMLIDLDREYDKLSKRIDTVKSELK